MSTLVSVSYCCDHIKGTNAWNNPQVIGGQAHAEWLEEAVDVYRRHLYDVMVSCTGFRGMINVEVSPTSYERDVMWRVFRRVGGKIVGVPDNPGHQVGAALCIRQGLETASKLGYDYLIHTAEDLLVDPLLLDAIQSLLATHDYVGSAWGPNRDELNAQVFACRVQALVGAWDSCAVTGHGCIERYLAHLMQGKRLYLEADRYRHTHDFALWKTWKKEWYP